MSLALVTGASGFVGWHVARLLNEKGYRVRALCRPQSQVHELPVERFEGDLRDQKSLAAACSGCDLVFHVAADYRLWSRRPAELYASNVDGTRNVLDAAAQAGARRIVYTSTVGCIGFVAGGLGDETTPVSLTDMIGHYKRSKFMAEQIALEKARAGAPIVIVNPTTPVGDHDWKPTPTGKIIVDFMRNKLPVFIDTGLNLVDVRDTAAAHLLAADKGRTGQRYLIGCENLTLQQILQRLARLTGKPAPTRQIPYAIAYAAGLVTTAWANITGMPPLAPLEAVRMARKRMFVSTAKAERELGFHPGSVDRALYQAIEWFQSRRYV